MTTDLERARAHLLAKQESLRRMRQAKAVLIHLQLQSYENAVLAALGWVWQCQEEERQAAESDVMAILRNLPEPDLGHIDWGKMWRDMQ